MVGVVHGKFISCGTKNRKRGEGRGERGKEKREKGKKGKREKGKREKGKKGKREKGNVHGSDYKGSVKMEVNMAPPLTGASKMWVQLIV